MKPHKIITPRINERGRHESESIVDATKQETGGKRKGRQMKKRARTIKRPTVTLENLQTARDNGGVYDPVTKCVIYNRKG